MHRHHHFFGHGSEHRGRHPWGGRIGPKKLHGWRRGPRAVIAADASAGSWNMATFASSSWPLLAEQPRHGYELIKELEDRTGGAYRPSPRA